MNETDGYTASRFLANNELEKTFWNSIDEITNTYNDWNFFLIKMEEKISEDVFPAITTGRYSGKIP